MRSSGVREGERYGTSERDIFAGDALHIRQVSSAAREVIVGEVTYEDVS